MTATIRIVRAVAVALVIVATTSTPGVASPPPGEWLWPVTGPVIEGFDPPDSPFGSGHRGIDVAAPMGTDVVAPADGTVTFAGPVGGRRFVTIDHGDGIRSTVSFVEALRVRAGDAVGAGDVVARSGTGHAGAVVPHVHLGVRIDDTYVDPMEYLSVPSVSAYIRLAPCCDAA